MKTKANMDLFVQREYNKKPLLGTFLLWRKIRIIRDTQELIKSRFERLKVIGDMFEMTALNNRFVQLERRRNELFDIATDYKFCLK